MQSVQNRFLYQSTSHDVITFLTIIYNTYFNKVYNIAYYQRNTKENNLWAICGVIPRLLIFSIN
jgi:hypothetical protein